MQYTFYSSNTVLECVVFVILHVKTARIAFIWYRMDALNQNVKELEKEHEAMIRCVLYYKCITNCFGQFSAKNKVPHRMTCHPTLDDMQL